MFVYIWTCIIYKIILLPKCFIGYQKLVYSSGAGALCNFSILFPLYRKCLKGSNKVAVFIYFFQVSIICPISVLWIFWIAIFILFKFVCFVKVMIYPLHSFHIFKTNNQIVTDCGRETVISTWQLSKKFTTVFVICCIQFVLREFSLWK